MNMTKPNPLQIVAGVGMLLALLGTFLAWWSLDVPKGMNTFGYDTSANGIDYTGGVFVLIFAILSFALLVLSLMPHLFPENLQLALLGVPVPQFALGAISFLIVLIRFFGPGSGVPASAMDRGLGLWLTLLGTLAWVGVTAFQSFKIMQMAQAMKASQQQPPAAPPTV